MIANSSTYTPAATERTDAVLLVKLDGRQYGLPLVCVGRVLPMAHVVSLPGSRDGVLGMLNLHGQVLPVIDPRPRLGLASPSLAPDHRLVLILGEAPFLLWVDEVDEVVTAAPEAITVVGTQQGNPLVATILRLGDSIVPVLAPSALEPLGR
jgi:chemotaxis signal transduction protein